MILPVYPLHVSPQTLKSTQTKILRGIIMDGSTLLVGYVHVLEHHRWHPTRVFQIQRCRRCTCSPEGLHRWWRRETTCVRGRRGEEYIVMRQLPVLPVRSLYAPCECSRLLPNSNSMSSKLAKTVLHRCWCCNRNQDMVELGLPWPNEMFNGRSRALAHLLQ
jgi:hypothetical protein